MLCSAACPCKPPADSGLDLSVLTTSASGSQQYLECSGEQLSIHKELRFAPLLYTLEREFNCAGICNEHDFLIFSEPRAPDGVCKDAIVNLIYNYESTYVGFCSTGAAVGLLGLLLSVATCRYRRIADPSWETYKMLR